MLTQLAVRLLLSGCYEQLSIVFPRTYTLLGQVG